MFELIQENQRRTVMLIGGMALVLLVLGYALAEAAAPGSGGVGLFGAVLVWIVMTIVSYFEGASVVLAISGARKIEKKDHPVLFNVVEEMCVASGLSKLPAIYVIDDEAPNAFATGRDPEHAVVAVTSGLLKLMTRDELQGVIAHEIGHVKNRDILYMTMAAVMMGAIILIADLGMRSMFHGRSRTSSRSDDKGRLVLLVVALALMILAPIIARLLYFAISRRREYLADASSAVFTRYPDGLASALEKLGSAKTRLRSANQATAPLYIVNPLKVTAQGLANLTATHPPLSERIRVLRSMGASPALGSYDEAYRKVTGRAVGVVPFSALQQPALPSPAMRSPAAQSSHIDRVRETTDLMWQLERFIFVACPCGTKLKIPPAYAGRSIECPHCGTAHRAQ